MLSAAGTDPNEFAKHVLGRALQPDPPAQIWAGHKVRSFSARFLREQSGRVRLAKALPSWIADRMLYKMCASRVRVASPDATQTASICTRRSNVLASTNAWVAALGDLQTVVSVSRAGSASALAGAAASDVTASASTCASAAVSLPLGSVTLALRHGFCFGAAGTALPAGAAAAGEAGASSVEAEAGAADAAGAGELSLALASFSSISRSF